MVMLAEFRTSRLPEKERFGRWCDMTYSALIPNMMRSDHESDFQAGLRLTDLGAVQVSRLNYPPLENYRPARLVRRSDPEGYQLVLNLRGGHRIIQGGKDTTGSEGELMLYDTSLPWRGWAGSDTGMVEIILVQFPRALLPLRAAKARPITARCLPGREGLGAILSSYLTQIAANADSLTVADGPRLATITIDLLAALCAHHLDAERTLPAETRQHTLLLRIHAFIHQHLADPQLSPALIAAAHNISVRTLHRLFQTQDATAAESIRTLRLDRCRRDLTDPAFHDRPIHAIAARWGFTDPAHFTRAFRAAYKLTPQDYRRQHQLQTHGRKPWPAAGRE